MIEEIVGSSVALFVIMGPFASVPVFLAVTRDVRDKTKAASYAVATAASVLFLFLFFGRDIMWILDISFPSLKIAGGLVLTLLGVELVLGFPLLKARYDYSPAITLIGTPLLTGPGVIVSTMIFVQDHGYLVAIIAAIVALGSSWMILSSSGAVSKLLGKFWLETITRVTGFLLVAIAIEFIMDGMMLI